jgi:NAD(P)-dependent dehydrogenase (short-subunit alcohol dehydrogenase family)
LTDPHITTDALYGAAKHGIWGAVKAVGVKVLPEGITVNCFGPSVVGTLDYPFLSPLNPSS